MRQVKMIMADGTKTVKHDSMHRETDFQGKTGEKKQGEPRKIPKTQTKPLDPDILSLNCLMYKDAVLHLW